MTNDQATESRAHTHDVASDETLTQAIVNAVATVSGDDPAPSDPSDTDALEPLHTVVDPEALESVFRSNGRADRSGGRVTFSYHGYDVTVRGRDRVTVARPGGEASD